MREMGKVAKRDYFRGQREVRVRATLCIFLLQQEMGIGKREQKKNGTRSLRDGLIVLCIHRPNTRRVCLL